MWYKTPTLYYLEAVHSREKIWCQNLQTVWQFTVHILQRRVLSLGHTDPPTGNMKATHTAVINMTHIVKSAGHKVSMENSFSHPHFLIA